MEIKEFAEIIREELEVRTGLAVTTNEARKNNNIVLHGICITEPGSNVMPTIYLEPYFDSYEDGMSMESILASIIKVAKDRKVSTSFDVNWFTDFEQVKDKIAFKLINYNDNKELLKEIPHTKFLDLAKVYFAVVESKAFGSGTIQIYNSHMETWGVTTEQLEEIATDNTPKLFPTIFIGLTELLEEIIPVDADLSEVDFGERLMYVTSNSKKFYGAAVMCYPNVIKDFAEHLESDLYILPSSIHELILIPTSEAVDEEKLKAMVRNVNQTLVAAEEILSDSVYKYSRENKLITIV